MNQSKQEAALAQIIAIMPPPPGATPPVDWNSVEAELGATLPDDYKHFCEVYGPGIIDRFTWIFHPVTGRPGMSLKDIVKEVRELLQEYIDEKDEDDDDIMDNPLLLDVNNLLPCGGTDNGHQFAWIMDGEPNQWRILVVNNKGTFFESGEQGIARSLLSLLNGSSSLFDHALPSGHYKAAEYTR